MLKEKLRNLILIIVLLISASVVFAQEYTPNQILFKTSNRMEIQRGKTGLVAFDSFLNDVQAFNVKPIQGMKENRWFSADIIVQPDWNALRSNSLRFAGIEIIQPNYLNTFHAVPNDPWYSLQQMNLVSLPLAWNYSTGSSTIVAGVVDSGLLQNHPDLQGNIFNNSNEIPDNGLDDDNNGYIDDYCGWDFADAPEMSDVALGDYLGQDNDVTDENFHGTHVSGIIGAVGNNGIGVTGVCWNVKILPIRAGFRTTTGTGFLQDDDAAAAIIYGADMGVSVMNLSWGDPNYSPIIADACNYAYQRGVVLVASAGNDPGPYLSYPAKLASVISVGAIDPYKKLAGFSSYGAELDLVAPGQQIYSTYKSEGLDTYKEMSGTSMSSPFVTGSAALLKSVQPNLTPDEVRSRLLSSTDDLGDYGFDSYYGHGLLNVHKLMENVSSPIVQITFPADNIGVSEDFDIIGTVNSDDFFRYSVMCAAETGPESYIWKDILDNSQEPNYFYQPVTNGVVAHFHIPDLMQEGKYLIRIQHQKNDGTKYNVFRSINLDQTPPFIRPNSFQVFKRYDGQNVRYYAGALFNEPVRSELVVTASNNQKFSTFPAKLDSIQVWLLPNLIPPGPIDVKIFANNNSNLSYESELMTNVTTIDYEIIPNYGYEPVQLGKPMIPLNRFNDLDGNGFPEFLTMDLPTSGYGDDKFFELNSDYSLSSKYAYPNRFIPVDMGNTNSTGLELLALNLDTITLYETLAASDYPVTGIWSETNVSGGIFGDYDNNNISDIILVKNLQTERVVQIFKRLAPIEISTPKVTLRNNTPTFLRNMFVPTLFCKNLDNDSRPDILTADTDGDIMIFEAISTTSAEMTWSHRLPVTNTYYLTTGDFDGNGVTDFMVGGYKTDVLDPNQNYWFFEGFTKSADNDYSSMGYVQFNQVMSQNAIQSYDLDSDGKHEIILSLSPNLYILKYINGNFQPVFHGNSHRTYQIAVSNMNNQPYFITNKNNDNDSLKAFIWVKQTPFTGPPTPANLIVRPLNETQVALSWQDNGAEFYRIYRDDPDNPFIEITSTEFIDSTVTEGSTYQYAITAVDYSYYPEESIRTQWMEAIPMSRPYITDVNMIGSNEIRVIFNQPLATSSLNPGCYEVDPDIGIPLSVNSVLNQYGVQLRFRNVFVSLDSLYELTLQNVYGLTGVALLDTLYSFSYNPDYTPPSIESSEVMFDKRSVKITMSESVFYTTATDIANYELVTPANDSFNSIQSVAVDDNIIIVTLREKLKYSNQFYYLILRHISDLAGNVIIPNQNYCRFALTDITNLDKVVVYPNPVIISKHSVVNFMNFPPDKKGSLAIYSLAGDLVYSTPIGPFSRDNNRITYSWDLKNQSGKRISSGIYYYVINLGGDTKRGKIALLN